MGGGGKTHGDQYDGGAEKNAYGGNPGGGRSDGRGGKSGHPILGARPSGQSARASHSGEQVCRGSGSAQRGPIGLYLAFLVLRLARHTALREKQRQRQRLALSRLSLSLETNPMKRKRPWQEGKGSSQRPQVGREQAAVGNLERICASVSPQSVYLFPDRDGPAIEENPAKLQIQDSTHLESVCYVRKQNGSPR
jgi:hypothetical protein